MVNLRSVIWRVWSISPDLYGSATQGRVRDPPWAEKKARLTVVACAGRDGACRLAAFDLEDPELSVVPVSL